MKFIMFTKSITFSNDCTAEASFSAIIKSIKKKGLLVRLCKTDDGNYFLRRQVEPEETVLNFDLTRSSMEESDYAKDKYHNAKIVREW